MKKLALLALCLSFSSVFASIYESDDNGTPTFSNAKLKDGHQLKLGSVNVLSDADVTKMVKQRVLTTPNYYPRPEYNNSTTMQGDFPEQYTDDYFDFYGRNHSYQHLMSSTIGLSRYAPNGQNNDQFRQAY